MYSPDRGGGSVETVVVTASPIAKHRDDTAANIAHLGRDDILAAGGTSIADSLSDVPGVTGSGFAPGASRPIIRGMDSNRVKLVENGLSSSDVSDVGPDHGVPLDPLSTQAIEVVRGAATLRYGSQAIGGVVNVLNNRVPVALSGEPFHAEASASYGSAANTGETALSADGTLGSFAVHADAYYRNTGDYETPLGRQDNSFFVGNGFALGGSYFFNDKSRTGAAVIQYDAKYGIPGEDAFILMRQTKFVSRSSFDVGLGPLQALTVDGSFANYSHEEKESDGTVGATFKNKEANLRIEQLVGALGPFSSLAAGVEVSNRDYSALGEASNYLYPSITTAVAGYVFADLPIGTKLNLETSARIETVDISGTPASDVQTSRTFTPFSAAAGLLYTATDWLKLGLTASTAGRAPAQTELFARGGHDGPMTYEIGDPALKIERAHSLEGTARINTGKFTAEFSGWHTWFDNYIYGAKTGRTCEDDGTCYSDDSAELRELFYRQQGARFWGLEGKASVVLFDGEAGGLTGDIQGDYVRATFSDGTNVPRIPAGRVGFGITWESDAFDIGMHLMAVSEQTRPGVLDTSTNSYNELNARAVWRPLDNIEIELSGHNLTDAVERNAAAFNKDWVISPGRDIRLTVHWRT